MLSHRTNDSVRKRQKTEFVCVLHTRAYTGAQNGHVESYKNSSGDEIANVNFFTTISHTCFKIPKKNRN